MIATSSTPYLRIILSMILSLVMISATQAFQATQQSTQQSTQELPEQKQETATQSSLSPLITAAELKALIDSGEPSLRVLEPAVKIDDFLRGHVPKAQYLHWVTDMTDPDNREQYNNLSSAQFAKLMNGLKLNNQNRIVIYDRLSSRLSTRLYWTLKYFGHGKVQILDGGHQAWIAQYRESDQIEHNTVENSKYKVREANSEILAQMAFVEKHLNDPKTKFVDGRPVDQFRGDVEGQIFHTKKAHPRNGHIPKAINVFWKDNFDKDGKFKSQAQLRELYQNAGIQPDQCVVTYCNEGLHAAPPWFVLTQLLGYKNVKLYDSSMAEWARSKNPMATSKKEGDQATSAQSPEKK